MLHGLLFATQLAWVVYWLLRYCAALVRDTGHNAATSAKAAIPWTSPGGKRTKQQPSATTTQGKRHKAGIVTQGICTGASLLLFLFLASLSCAAEPATFANTAPLQWEEEDLSERMMDGAHSFVERKIVESAAQRHTFWNYDFSSRESYRESIAENRSQLKVILGVVDERLPVRMERYGDDAAPALVTETTAYRVFQVRWPVLPGVFGEGLLVQPKRNPLGHIIVVPDASEIPEQTLGLGGRVDPAYQLGRRLAESGFEVVVPQTVGRRALETDDPRLRRADYTDREWIYRQAFHMGRHVIGYEVQQVLSLVDWFSARRTNGQKIGIAGYGEGGQTAFFAAATDERIDVSLVSGYFAAREEVWSEPIYRNVWSRLIRFGDAEVASLVLPRQLIIEHCRFPDVNDHKGRIATAARDAVAAEFNRIPFNDVLPPPSFIVAPRESETAFSEAAVSRFAEAITGTALEPMTTLAPEDFRPSPGDELMRRRHRSVNQLEQHVQSLVRGSEHVRDRTFLYTVMPELAGGGWSTERRHPTQAKSKFIEGAKPYRRRFHLEAMGEFNEPLVSPNPRTRLIAETDAWRAFDVVLDVFDGLFAWGVLVVPKDIKPGEQRPVVVCQHGRQGLPRDTIDGHKTAYNDFAAKLAERGFITFAPHNLYRGEDRYRWLDRKANTIGCTLFSFIIAQHDQTLRWLDSLPQVDGDRIAFYGLSYGGETAVRVPSILEKYCLSICSGDFNQWTRKVAATDQPFSFMNTIEWEMPYWNLGHTFDYAEMTYLMAPRPFMVERGHHDRVGRDRWVAHEFAKVRWLYAQLGLADRLAIDFFQGGHSINGEASFDFLHKHLEWPKPKVDEEALWQAVTLYASFDDSIAADLAGGEQGVQTRADNPGAQGTYDISAGFPENAFRIASGAGVSEGALQAIDVLPNRGRLFFPAAGNIGYRSEGWSGSVSFWLRTNPDKLLKTRFCDPIQITEKRSSDGALWVDFPDTSPRDLRLGAFRALGDNERAVPDTDPAAPLIVLPEVGFAEDDWHHVAMTWHNFDTGHANARVTLYIDGQVIGALTNREIAMEWEIEKAGIYFAVNYIGLLDELAVFERELSPAEISHLKDHPGCLSGRSD